MVSDWFLFYQRENRNIKISNNLPNFTQLGSTKLDFNLGLLSTKVPLSSRVLCYLSRFLEEKQQRPYHTAANSGLTTAVTTNWNVMFTAIFNNKIHLCSQLNWLPLSVLFNDNNLKLITECMIPICAF